MTGATRPSAPRAVSRGGAFDVSEPWDADNQAWWDWYVGLAHNDPASERGAPDENAQRPRQDDVPPLSDDELLEELSTPYNLDRSQIARFRADGYVKLPGVVSPRAAATLRREIIATLEAAFDATLDSGARDVSTDRKAPPGRRFYSAEMVWLTNSTVRAFVLSPRIAKISADLLGVDGVRLYHDNLLSKEPDCGRTPWHYDDHHFPLATNDVVTAWIAAQAIPKPMGPLAFARGADAWRLVADVPFSKTDTSYDRRVAQAFADAGVDVDDSPYAAGEASFHHNLSFHTAGGNATSTSRCALANTFFADGARVMDAPTMVSGDWRKFMPGVEPGDVADSALNPVCWPARDDWARASVAVDGDANAV